MATTTLPSQGSPASQSPVTSTPSTQTQTSSPRPAEPKYTAMQKRIIDLLKVHQKTAMMGRATDSQIREGIKCLMDATTLMLRDGTAATFDLMWEYHVEGQNSYCSEVKAMRGITNFTQAESYPTSLVYNAFRAIIEKRFWGNFNRDLSKIQGGPRLIDYLNARRAQV